MPTLRTMMPSVTTGLGVALTVLGFGALVLSGFRIATPISTGLLGLVLLLCGWVAHRNQTKYGLNPGIIWGFIVSLIGLALTGSEIFFLNDIALGTAPFPIATLAISGGAILLFGYALMGLMTIMTAPRYGAAPKDLRQQSEADDSDDHGEPGAPSGPSGPTSPNSPTGPNRT